ncbi:cytochrome c biogenesis protein CcsB [Moorella thermoacetica]|uniref:cytochrome c biogenesis protein ResB n=1 Tax=Neomoorella thermoacetica TaxID=1525 RepID=UPI0006A296DB|nr:cytochrome c biogenesis protein ResB [Moorella thermoacetica]AKX95042.1 cytochrome c biogenesis protein CcsB [Moorella thermoacetica]
MPSTNLSGIIRKVWQGLISMRLALVLLLVMAGVAVLETIIPQGNPPAFYQYAYGPWRAGIIRFFQLDKVYRSWIFLGLTFLLTASLLACVVNRWNPLWRQVTTFHYRCREDDYTGAPAGASGFSTRSAGETVASLVAGCRRRHYRVFTSEEEGRFYLYADRGRFGVLGSLLTHLSVVLIVAGGLYSGLAGYRGYVNIPAGATVPIPRAGFAVRLDDFRIDYYSDGLTPRQYYSTLTVIEGGREVEGRVIAVNAPLTYKGVTLYQASYGWVIDGVLVNRGQTTRFALPDRQTISLAGDLRLKPIFYPDYTVDPAGHPGSKSPRPVNPRVGYILMQGTRVANYSVTRLGEPVSLGDGLEVTFTGYRQYTGLKIAHDPGIPVVYTGAALLLLGLFLVFYMRRRQIWALAIPADGGCHVSLAGAAPRSQARLETDIKELLAEATGR